MCEVIIELYVKPDYVLGYSRLSQIEQTLNLLNYDSSKDKEWRPWHQGLFFDYRRCQRW